MDIPQLEWFVSVADLGSFSRAAMVLRVPQPRLSRAIRALEVELHQSLFHRNGRGVRLTEPGERFLAHCRSVLVQLERARAELEDARGEPTGQVRVGFPASIARLLSVPCARAFRAQFPQGMLRITEGLTVHLQEWLLAGRLDVALLHDPVPSAALETVPLRREPLCLVGPKPTELDGQPVPLRELAGLPLVMSGKPHPMRMFVETQLNNAGLKPDIVVEIDSIGAIIDLVASGFGYAIVSRNALAARGGGQPLGWRPIVAPELTSALVLAYSAERPVTALMKEATGMLMALLDRVLPRGRSQLDAMAPAHSS